MANRLSRSERLRRKPDFERVLFRGRHLKGDAVSLYYAVNSAAGPDQAGRRAAFITAGKFRTAPARNRVKRRLREIFRTNLESFPDGADLILRGEPQAAALPFGTLRGELLKLAARATELRKSSPR